MFRFHSARRRPRQASQRRHLFAARPNLEQLESRDLLSAYPLTPLEVRTAYGFTQLSASLNGSGQTIAIVDAYDHPTIFGDLDTFDNRFSWDGGTQSLYQAFGASSQVLTKVTQTGKIRADAGW